MSLQIEIGKQIKAARKAKGLTQKELAPMLGVDETRVSLMENGKVNLTAKTIEETFKVLGVQVIISIQAG